MWVVNGQIRLSDGALLVEAALVTGAYLVRAWSVRATCSGSRARFSVPRPAHEGASAKLAAMDACLRENRPERCCFGGAYNRRRGVLVLQRMPIRQP